MDHTTELLRIAEQQSLDPERFRRLQALASPQPQPDTSNIWLRKGLLILAALCLGLALIFWVAANWHAFSTFQRFAIVETLLAISLLAGCFPTRLRPAALLLAILVLGGLLALYAQVYNTGGDSWRLFAFWAAMALPITLAARHQAAWISWVFIVLIAVNLWLQDEIWLWGISVPGTLIAWCIILILAAAMYPRGILKAWLGLAPHLAFRWAACLGVIFIGYTALGDLFGDTPWVALIGLAVMVGIWGVLYAVRYPDISIYALCALCIDMLIVASLIRFLATKDELVSITLLVGAISVALLLYSITLLKKIQRIVSQDNISETYSESGSSV